MTIKDPQAIKVSSSLSSEKIVCELMYHAFLDMREEARKVDNRVIYHVCDLLHNVPKMILQVEQGKSDFTAILKNIQEKATTMGIEQWLHHQIHQIDKDDDV